MKHRVNTKNDDTSNPGFLSVPHKSFVKLREALNPWKWLFKSTDIVLF